VSRLLVHRVHVVVLNEFLSLLFWSNLPKNILHKSAQNSTKYPIGL
jgi:hypothetical protein